MTKKTRTILFSILFLLFLIIAPSIIFYCLGYRFDFGTKKITQTGAFYFKVFPKSTQIHLTPLDNNSQIINNKVLTKKTDFFFGASFIDNLLPQPYEVEIKKEGFYPWKKILEVEEKKVTDAKNIVLIPENIPLTSLNKEVSNFYFFPDEKKIILKEANKNSWSLKLFDVGNNVKSSLIEQKDLSIGGTSTEILDLKFSADSKKILLKVNSGGGIKYFLVDVTQSQKVVSLPATSSQSAKKNTLDVPFLASLDFLGKNIGDISFYPNNNQKLLLFRDGMLSEVDWLEKNISSKLLENIISYKALDKNVYYLDGSGFLYKTDYSFLGKEKINETSFPLDKNKVYNIVIFQDKIFLQDEKNLFLLDPETATFENFFETKKGPEGSPDSTKLAYFSDSEIWVLFLKAEGLSQPLKTMGDKVFVARFSEKIGRVFWLTNHYLIFSCGDKIKVAEIDDRDKINIVDLVDLKSQETQNNSNNYTDFYFSRRDHKVYILNNGSLYVSEIPLP